jgi:hypothetical protein
MCSLDGLGVFVSSWLLAYVHPEMPDDNRLAAVICKNIMEDCR